MLSLEKPPPSALGREALCLHPQRLPSRRKDASGEAYPLKAQEGCSRWGRIPHHARLGVCGLPRQPHHADLPPVRAPVHLPRRGVRGGSAAARAVPDVQQGVRRADGGRASRGAPPSAREAGLPNVITATRAWLVTQASRDRETVVAHSTHFSRIKAATIGQLVDTEVVIPCFVVVRETQASFHTKPRGAVVLQLERGGGGLVGGWVVSQVLRLLASPSLPPSLFVMLCRSGRWN